MTLGRPNRIQKYESVTEYLNEYVFKVKDLLFELKETEFEKRKEHKKALAKMNLQIQKLEMAYAGLEEFRKKDGE